MFFRNTLSHLIDLALEVEPFWFAGIRMIMVSIYLVSNTFKSGITAFEKNLAQWFTWALNLTLHLIKKHTFNPHTPSAPQFPPFHPQSLLNLYIPFTLDLKAPHSFFLPIPSLQSTPVRKCPSFQSRLPSRQHCTGIQFVLSQTLLRSTTLS